MARRIEFKWFRLWAPEMLGQPDPDGFNAYKEFGPQENWCWIELRALCASTDYQPAICVTPFQGYTDQQLADLFKVDLRVWKNVKARLELAHKIEVDAANIIVVVGWERFGGRYFQGRQNRDREMMLWSEEKGEAEKLKKKAMFDVYKRVMTHFVAASGKNFRVGCDASFKHFSARFNEGATEEQFIHVIDVKCAQWRGRDDMEVYLRPQTLFNSEKFWGYVAERPVRKVHPIGGIGSMSVLPEELEKYEAAARKEYQARLKTTMEQHGWKSDQEIPPDAYFKGLPTFSEYLRIYIKKMREKTEWRPGQ